MKLVDDSVTGLEEGSSFEEPLAPAPPARANRRIHDIVKLTGDTNAPQSELNSSSSTFHRKPRPI